MAYDLHVHSCLSPCADDEMTPNNIVNMALIKGLNMLSVTDHNHMGNQKAIAKVAIKKGLKYIYGVEVQTSEDIHVLCYFKEKSKVDVMNDYLIQHLPKIDNKVAFFGHQIYCNEMDEIIDEEKTLLLNSLDVSISELTKNIHKINGYVVLAHIFKSANGIIPHLGFIPKDLKIDGIEIKDESQRIKCIQMHPWLKDIPFFINSDAHQLIDIQEAIYKLKPGGWINE